MKKIKITYHDKYIKDDYLEFLSNAFAAEDIEVELTSFETILKGEGVRGIQDVDLVIYTGGPDLSPDYYAENTGKYTDADKKRDKDEIRMYNTIRDFNRPVNVGICRGAHLLTAMSGGSIIQHVENHKEEHEIIAPDHNLELITNSTHHQMMYPYNLSEDKFDLIAHSLYFKSSTYLDGNNEEMQLDPCFLEPEIVYYKNTNSIAIQGHPEKANAKEDFKNFCASLITDEVELRLLEKSKKSIENKKFERRLLAKEKVRRNNPLNEVLNTFNWDTMRGVPVRRVEAVPAEERNNTQQGE